jgi:hypothetical protein
MNAWHANCGIIFGVGSIAHSDALSNRRPVIISVPCTSVHISKHAHAVSGSFPCVGSTGEKYVFRKFNQIVIRVCSRNYLWTGVELEGHVAAE